MNNASKTRILISASSCINSRLSINKGADSFSNAYSIVNKLITSAAYSISVKPKPRPPTT